MWDSLMLKPIDKWNWGRYFTHATRGRYRQRSNKVLDMGCWLKLHRRHTILGLIIKIIRHIGAMRDKVAYQLIIYFEMIKNERLPPYSKSPPKYAERKLKEPTMREGNTTARVK